MNCDRIWRSALLSGVVILSIACGEPASQAPDAGPPQPEDAGTTIDTPDAGEPPAPGGPDITSSEAYGAFLPSPARAILTGTDTTLIGVQAMASDPEHWGLPGTPDGDYTGWMHPGLMMLETATGEIRTYTSEDGLPTMEYQGPFGSMGTHTVSFFDLAWIVRDQSFIAAAYEYVVKGVKDANGAWTFSSTRLQASGANGHATVGQVAVAGDEVFVGSDQGVAVLDPTDLAVKRWVSLGVSVTGPWIADLTTGDMDSEPVVGIVFGAADAPPSYVAIIKPGQANAQLFSFSDGSKPHSVLGTRQFMIVGAEAQDGRGILYFVGPTISGIAMDVLVPSEDLATSSSGAVIPAVMAFDGTHQKLILGGKLQSTGARGMAQLSMDDQGFISGTAEDLVAPSDPYAELLPFGVDAMSVDDTGRLYFTGKRLCSEHKTKQLPVYRLERDAAGAPRMVNPWVSGVRDLEIDPVNGDTWLALRNGAPGMTCDGLPVGQSVCRLRADGACEIVPITTNDGDSLIGPVPGVADLAFGSVEKKELAFATLGDGTWVRKMETGRRVDTQFNPRLSLSTTSAAWGVDGVLWVGSKSTWESYPDLDEQAVNRRMPHGLGFMVVQSDTTMNLTRRYVRAKSDNTDVQEVEGLPSDTVLSVMHLPASGDRSALASMGLERRLSGYDHVFGEPSPTNARGGIVLIEDAKVTPLTLPEGTTYSDVPALAKGKDDAWWAVDSELGVLKLDLVAKTASVWAKPAWAATERALSLAVDGAGRVAVGTTAGLYVYGSDTGVSTVFTGGKRGYVWRLRFTADGALLAGTDQGLSRIAIEGATLPALGPVSYADRDLWPLAPPCGGVTGCACLDMSDCASGYLCGCDPTTNACACEPADACTLDPGGKDCMCANGSNTCNAGLTCACTFLGCSCQVDPATCANGACTCTDFMDCPQDWYCGAGVCGEFQQCDYDCTCATTSGCSPGLTCDTTWNWCVEPSAP